MQHGEHGELMHKEKFGALMLAPTKIAWPTNISMMN